MQYIPVKEQQQCFVPGDKHDIGIMNIGQTFSLVSLVLGRRCYCSTIFEPVYIPELDEGMYVFTGV